jgi:chorismate mutase/prephenate dehydratase
MKLQQLRTKIDSLDRQILKLLNQRLDLALKIGQAKASTGQEVFAPEREAALLARLRALNRGPLPTAALEAIYREVLAASRSAQKRLRIGVYGSQGSYAHVCAKEFFGALPEFRVGLRQNSIVSALSTQKCDYVIAPCSPPRGTVAVAEVDGRPWGGKVCHVLKLSPPEVLTAIRERGER